MDGLPGDQRNTRQRSLSQMMTDLVVDDGSGLVATRDVLGVIEEAEGQHCPEDYGFIEWIGVLKKRDNVVAHTHLQEIVSLLLQTMVPIGPMRDRTDYPAELQRAIDFLHGRVAQSAVARRYANPFKVLTSEWQTDRGENQVTCHSRMVDGVLCRWWGDDEPPGTAKIDAAASAQSATPSLEAPQPDKAPVNPVDAVRFPCSICGQPADGHSHTIRATTDERLPDPGTEKLLRTLLDRAYKMMLMSGYRVQEHNPDHNDPIIAWMSDARAVLYGSGRQPDLGTLT